MFLPATVCKPVLNPQYPEWLESNKTSLSAEDYQRYEQQAKVMGEICKHFEEEGHGADDKDGSFESIMGLMQQVDTVLLS